MFAEKTLIFQTLILILILKAVRFIPSREFGMSSASYPSPAEIIYTLAKYPIYDEIKEGVIGHNFGEHLFER